METETGFSAEAYSSVGRGAPCARSPRVIDEDEDIVVEVGVGEGEGSFSVVSRCDLATNKRAERGMGEKAEGCILT